jgi:hypothetical protein
MPDLQLNYLGHVVALDQHQPLAARSARLLCHPVAREMDAQPMGRIGTALCLCRRLPRVVPACMPCVEQLGQGVSV